MKHLEFKKRTREECTIDPLTPQISLYYGPGIVLNPGTQGSKQTTTATTKSEKVTVLINFHEDRENRKYTSTLINNKLIFIDY